MSKIVLTAEQIDVLHQSSGVVEFCDLTGKTLCISRADWLQKFVAEQKRRAASPGPWYSGDDVQPMFRFLEDAWSKEGGFDDARSGALVAEFEANHGQPSRRSIKRSGPARH